MSISRDPLYRRHRFPPEVISYAVWLYFRFPLSLRMVKEMLAARHTAQSGADGHLDDFLALFGCLSNNVPVS
jgi:transposase-like protein